MRTIFTMAYIVSGFYSICLCIDFISCIRKEKNLSGITKVGPIKRYGGVLLCICLIATPLDFYSIVMSNIPEGEYSIDGILEIDGDETRYSVPMIVDYSIDREYITDDNHDYLFDGGTSTKTEIIETFFLLDITPPSKLAIKDFVFDYFDGMPEYINSNATYDIEICGQQRGYEEGFGGKLIIPPLTKEILGITLEDQLADIGVLCYIEHILLLFSVVVCFLLICKRKQMESKNTIVEAVINTENRDYLTSSAEEVSKQHQEPHVDTKVVEQKQVYTKYCSRCGNGIDPVTKVCVGCGKQYFKGIPWKKVGTVAGIVILIFSIGLNVYMYTNQIGLQKTITVLTKENTELTQEYNSYKKSFELLKERLEAYEAKANNSTNSGKTSSIKLVPIK